MMLYIKLALSVIALWIIKPFAWAERVLTGGRKLEGTDRFLAALSVFGVCWNAGMLAFAVPSFRLLAAELQLPLGLFGEALANSCTFEWACGGFFVTTLLAVGLKLPMPVRRTLLVVTAFGGFFMSQIIRLSVTLPFLGCPHS